MASARPVVSVLDSTDGTTVKSSLKLPEVFTAPIRLDVVQHVQKDMAKNKRQAYAVSLEAGHMATAQSWGTGRAVSRAPRVGGGGTHRSGQVAYGNFARGGHMFAPTKIYRKWHRKINVKQRRYAVTSALAASAVPALVQARGHKISQVSEIPCVVSDDVSNISKTKQAMAFLRSIGAAADVEKAKNSRSLRCGKGKLRSNRRYTQRRGPLFVFSDATSGVQKSFRNLPGLELCNVSRLNLLQIAPGGHVGRFIIFTEDAFKQLDTIFSSKTKSSFVMPRHMVTVGDVARIINSDEIQSVVNAAKKTVRRSKLKKNPLKNPGVMARLNPYSQTMRRAEVLGKRKAVTKVDKATKKARKAASKKFYENMMEDESEEEESSEEEEEEEE